MLKYMLKKRQGRDSGDQLVLRYPTPESIYSYYPIPLGAEDSCADGCSKTYCLYDICMTQLFEKTHFPMVRPISLPVAFNDKNTAFKPRYVR